MLMAMTHSKVIMSCVDGAVLRHRGHLARLDPEPKHIQALDNQGHAARALWNLLHEWWTFHRHRRPTLAQADSAIRQARNEIDWLAVLPAQAAQQVLKAYHRAWVNCWEGRAGPPRFKSRIRARLSIDVPQGRDLHVRRVNRRWGQVKIPKVGRIRFRWTKDLPGINRNSPTGRLTGARLIREPLGWHIVFRTETTVPAPQPHPGPLVGIDVGVAVPLALSDGTIRTHGPWLSNGEAIHLQRLERKSARQRAARLRGEPVSRRLSRTYDQIARIRARAKRRVLDWQHKTTTELTGTFGTIGVEDLSIVGMVASARGNNGTPGRNVRQKAGLNRAIAGQAWGRTIELLTYKLADRGGILIKVSAVGTSQRCHACGMTMNGSRRSQALFSCQNTGCGWTGNADHNAACNIKNIAEQ